MVTLEIGATCVDGMGHAVNGRERMMCRIFAGSGFVLASAAGMARPPTDPPPLPGPPMYDHIVIVVDENRSYQHITDTYASSAPYINQTLIAQGASLTNFYGEEHHSQGNYLWMFAGSNFDIGFNNPVPVGPFDARNLGSSLIASGWSFKGYSENLPEIGSTVGQSGPYARKHNPWVNFGNVPNGSTVETSSNLRMLDFPTDFSLLPTVSIVVPDLNNDMHDGSIEQGDGWIHDHFDAYYQWARTHNSLLIVTFDEDDGGTEGLTNPALGENHVVTVMAGAGIAPGAYTEGAGVNHINLLRTIEDMYGLPHAGGQTPLASAAGFNGNPIKNVYVQWQFDSDGNWSDGAKWVGGVAPSGLGAVANFLGSIAIDRTITLDSPVTTNVINIDNSNTYTIAGISTLTLDGVSDARAAIHVRTGAHTIAAPLALARDCTLDIAAHAILTIDRLALTSVNITKTGSGLVNISRVRANDLTIAAGTVSITENTRRLHSLTLGGTDAPKASLDLNEQGLVLTGDPRAKIESMIALARSGGAWNQNGLTSSAARTQANHATTLGVIDGQQFISVYGAVALFGDFAVSASDVLVKYTWYGDADFNGVVNFDDYARIDSGFSNGYSGWFNGDFNLNGTIDFDDYALIDHAFNSQSQPLHAVPEPGALISTIVLIFGAAVARHRSAPADSGDPRHPDFMRDNAINPSPRRLH
ncbi:hypothetical protein BH09PLA1_BH09PLA1_33530 [soil metagenome]